jgi:Mn2+/Fe2+ NRAMP family transporter
MIYSASAFRTTRNQQRKACATRPNLPLTVVAIMTWVWNRKSIRNLTVISMVALGLAYPFLAFFVELLIGGTIYR